MSVGGSSLEAGELVVVTDDCHETGSAAPGGSPESGSSRSVEGAPDNKESGAVFMEVSFMGTETDRAEGMEASSTSAVGPNPVEPAAPGIMTTVGSTGPSRWQSGIRKLLAVTAAGTVVARWPR